MPPNTLEVALAASPARHYPIHIGHGLLADAALIMQCAPQRQICIVTNDTVAAHYLAPLETALADKTRITVRLPDGETHKTLATWASILDALVAARYDRDSLVIALGGGIVGDIAGFAAASYQRGIACLQIPTTLLAQVDSSVGGKTGVNHPQGKNLIGAFHQPQAVLIDTATLAQAFPAALVPTDGFGEIPEGWEVSTIGESVETVGGATPSTKEESFWLNGDIHWTTPKDLSNLTDNILIDTNKKITAQGLKKISSGLLPVNTVLMSSRAPVGYLALTKIPVAINQGYIAIKPFGKLSCYYMIQWCYSNMEEIKGRAIGTTFAEISKTNFRGMKIVVPPKFVLAAYNKIIEPIYNRITSNNYESKQLSNTRDLLLPKLLSNGIL